MEFHEYEKRMLKRKKYGLPGKECRLYFYRGFSQAITPRGIFFQLTHGKLFFGPLQ